MCGSRRELRRIEDDQVERSRGVAQLAQPSEHVGLQPLRAGCGEGRVARDVVARESQRLGRAVDRNHVRSTTRERCKRESTRIAERVQHATVPRMCADERAIVTLVEVEARLLAADDVDTVMQAGFDDVDGFRQRTGDDADARR